MVSVLRSFSKPTGSRQAKGESHDVHSSGARPYMVVLITMAMLRELEKG